MKVEITQERWDKVVTSLADIPHIKEAVGRIDETVNGNGKPGLKQRVHDLDKWKENECEEIKENTDFRKRQNWLKELLKGVLMVGTGSGVVSIVLYFINR